MGLVMGLWVVIKDEEMGLGSLILDPGMNWGESRGWGWHVNKDLHRVIVILRVPIDLSGSRPSWGTT